MDLLSKQLADWENDLRVAHVRYREVARSDPQKAGHSAEGIWVKVATEILPPTYGVLVRKYMKTEVDVVILPPSAPKFYDDAAVTDIPPDVASAVIHVKNTLDRAELRDAMKRVHLVNQGRREYRATREREREGLPSAIVALGSEWTGGFDSALKAFMEILDDELHPGHPSQIPAFIATPDWDIHNYTIDLSPPAGYQPTYAKDDPKFMAPHVLKVIATVPSGKPVHAFAQWLYTACGASDPSLESMRVALTQQFSLSGQGTGYPFEASAVYSDSRLVG